MKKFKLFFCKFAKMKFDLANTGWLLLLVFLLLTASSVVFIAFVVRAERTLTELETKRLMIRLETLRSRSDSLAKAAADLRILQSPDTLYARLLSIASCYAWGKDWAACMTAVAVQESGRKLNKGAVKRTLSPFGFHLRKSPYVCGYYDENGERFSQYETRLDALNDALLWTLQIPPKDGESMVDFIKRRKYNPQPSYYGRIERIINHCKFK